MSKAKKINFELIEEENPAYKILEQMRKHHPHLEEAVIVLAWRLRLKPDKDCHLVLGKCVKSSDLQRELHSSDFVILLNREIWEDSDFTEDKKRALIDHELCHAAVSTDDEGLIKWDDRHRIVYRTRKHDIEEFQSIVHRHGCYKKDLEIFADALLKKRRTPLLNEDETRVSLTGPGGEKLFEGTSAEFTEGCHRVAQMSAAEIRRAAKLAN